MAGSASVAAPTAFDALLEDSSGEDDRRARSRPPTSVLEKTQRVSNLSNVGVQALVSKDVSVVQPVVHPFVLEQCDRSDHDVRWKQMLNLVAEQHVGMYRAVEVAAVAAAAAAEAVRCLQTLSVARFADHSLALPIASVTVVPIRSPGTATTVVDRPTVSSTLSMSVGEAIIPDRITHGISNATSAFEKDINKFVNANEKLKHKLEDIVFMKQPGNKYPPGVRPLKSPVEQVTLDSNLASAVNADQVWSVELPQGISRRGALQIIHHAVAVSYKEVRVESLTEYLAQLQSKVSKQSFIAKCDVPCASTPIDGLGLEEPIATQLDDDRIKRRMESEYKRIVEGIRQQRADLKKKKESEIAKNKAAEQLLIESKPEDLLLDIVEGRVREGLRDNGFDDSMDDSCAVCFRKGISACG